MTTAHRDTRTPKALLVTLAIVVISHALTQDSASTWMRSLPLLLIMVLGELVREYVVARVPATDDTVTRARRRRMAGWWVVGGVLISALIVAPIKLGWVGHRSAWIFPPFIAFAVALNVAAGLVHADMAQKARSKPAHERTPPSAFVLLILIVAALVAIAGINEPLYESVRAGHTMHVAQSVRLVVSVVTFAAFVVLMWRGLNRYAEADAATSTEHTDG